MNDLKQILKERSNIYGDLGKGMHLSASIMEMILTRYREEHKNEMPKVFELFIYHIVIKIVRLAVSPTHVDSWDDIAGYSIKISEVLNANK